MIAPSFYMRGHFFLDFVFLSDSFYEAYSNCPEIECKRDRPYVRVCVRINGVLFAVPFRSHINHKYVLWTDEENHCGLDFSKAVVIASEKFIDRSREPHIRPNEFDSLRGKEQLIAQRMRQYIRAYKKARVRMDVPRNRIVCQYSTLQYFESYLGRLK